MFSLNSKSVKRRTLSSVSYTHLYKDRDFALTNKIVAYIEQKGGTAKGLMSNVEAISDNEFELEDIPQDTQCILVLGGDGTLIRAATRVETLEIPLMGVNLGTLGYLCEVEMCIRDRCRGAQKGAACGCRIGG